jgi:hypothetical protein
MACDPNALLNQARCFQCCSEKELQQVIASLLCQISTGGAGGANLTSGHGAPTSTPTSSVAIYIDEDTGAQYNWFSGSWH